MIRNIPIVTRSLLIAIGVSFLISLIIPGFAALLALISPLVFQNFQVWRLITWPLYSPGFFSSITAVLLLYYFGPELELIVKSRTLGISIVVSVVICGALFLIIAPASAIAGTEFLYLYVLCGFTYLWPRRALSVFGIFTIKAWIVTLIVLLLTLLPLQGHQIQYSLTNFFPPIAALLSAAIFFHVMYRQYTFGSSLIVWVENLFGHSRRIRGRDATWSDKLTVEHRVDAILDKISRKGMDSLSREEHEFLLKHSQGR